MKIIVSSQDDSWEEAALEMKKYADGQIVKWLNRGVGIFEVKCDFDQASAIIRKSGGIFIRHMFPLEYETELCGFDSALEDIARRMDDNTFSVQMKSAEQTRDGLGKHELTQRASAFLRERGHSLDVKSPSQIISVVLCGNLIYMGLSSPKQNLSAWPGGERRFLKEDARISRAEFKLLEAEETFDLPLSAYRDGLDLGAAPGGWTRVLLERGLYVTAVDPANMSDKLNRKRLTIFPYTAQEFLRKNNQQFDIIVNDMRMDAVESARLMIEFADRLTDRGVIVMTFKLPEKKKKTVVEKGLAVLSGKYSELRARQLFHNRSEITVIGYK